MIKARPRSAKPRAFAGTLPPAAATIGNAHLFGAAPGSPAPSVEINISAPGKAEGAPEKMRGASPGAPFSSPGVAHHFRVGRRPM